MSYRTRAAAARSRSPVYNDTSESEETSDDTQSSSTGGEQSSDRESSSGEEEAPEAHIQMILGVKDDDNTQYYVKWTDMSYIHCSWLSAEELKTTPGGEQALRKFKKKISDEDLSRSSSVTSLMTYSQDDLNANWFKIDRILEHEDGKYLVKWKSLPYDQATWEDEDDIKDEDAIRAFEARRHHNNSTVIDKNGRNVDVGKFETITEGVKDKHGNTLREYQLKGLNWLRFCWHNKRNSILADEMGLGKTVQIVSVLNDIATNHGISGPFMVIAPLSTLGHWRGEVERWSNLNAIVYHGSPSSREIIEEYEFPAYGENGKRLLRRVQFDVLITNYETFVTDFSKFREIEWRYLVLDEGHRLKNHTGKCYQLIQQLTYEHCTLLTGTPIQNNVEELWSLLHLLHPKIFNDLSDFLARFGEIDNVETLAQLQELIRPFLLRRKKGEVETSIAAKEETIIMVELTRIQKTYYRALLHESSGMLLQQITGGSLPSLLNLMMQLRKVCNHPFLIKGAEQNIVKKVEEKHGEGADEDEVYLEALVDASGKMILLDKLLPKLKDDGHKVLIFSQMVKVLDIVEEYLCRKDFTYERIDGGVSETDRQSAIDRFANDPDIFIFLLCTRAGGVGINLTAADTVIIFDSDWNPQNDVQAQSRCHRIGQKSKVKVYRLVTRGTYELEMLDRASKKLGLDHALLDGGEINQKEPMAAKEIERLLRHGAYDITRDDDKEIDEFCQADIDQILEERAQKFTCAGVSTSLFNKARFDPEQDTLDLNAEDFWQKVLPQVSVSQEEPISQRRCRRHNRQFVDKSSSDEEEDSGAQERVVRKKTSPVSIRGTIRQLLSYGLGDSVYEKAILHQAAVMSDLSDSDKSGIAKLLGIEDLEQPGEEISTALEEFCSNLNDVRDRKSSIVRRCLMFSRLHPLMKQLQGPVQKWPPSDVVDPINDYALLLGVEKNGIGDGTGIFEGIEGVEVPKVMSLKALEKRLFGLIEALEQLVEPLPENSDEIELKSPIEWKKIHTTLYNRADLNDEELQILFQTIAGYGLPRCEEGIDWKKVMDHSRLTCVSLEAVEKAGLLIQEFSAQDDDASDNQPLPIVARLGTYGGKQWQRKLRNAIRDIEKVRSFVNNLKEGDMYWISNVKQFDATSWWEAKHDLALLKSIAEYGQLLVATWVVDPDRPFRQEIPADLLEEFEKAAETERLRGRQCKPKETGDLAFLFKDKLRMTRALLVIKYVEVHREKGEEKRKQIPSPQIVPQIKKMPKLPLNISSQTILISLGKFLTRDAPYPVGYVVHTLFISPVKPDEGAWFEVTLNMNDFVSVQMLSEPYLVFTGKGIEAPFEQIVIHAQRVAEASGIDFIPPPVNVRTLCGLNTGIVYDCFQQMRSRVPAQPMPLPQIGGGYQYQSPVIAAVPRFIPVPKPLIPVLPEEPQVPEARQALGSIEELLNDVRRTPGEAKPFGMSSLMNSGESPKRAPAAPAVVRRKVV